MTLRLVVPDGWPGSGASPRYEDVDDRTLDAYDRAIYVASVELTRAKDRLNFLLVARDRLLLEGRK